MAEAEESTSLSGKGALNSKSSKRQSSRELTEFLKSSIKNVLDQVTDEEFVSIYKACYKEFEKKDDIVRPSLSGSSVEGRKYRSQFNDIIMKNTSKTVEETILNMNLKFKELEELQLSQSNSKNDWRPPGNAYEHIIPFGVVSQMEKKKDLEGKIEREQEALSIVKSRLIQKRIKAIELNNMLSALMAEMQNTLTSKVNEEQATV